MEKELTYADARYALRSLDEVNEVIGDNEINGLLLQIGIKICELYKEINGSDL